MNDTSYISLVLQLRWYFIWSGIAVEVVFHLGWYCSWGGISFGVVLQLRWYFIWGSPMYFNRGIICLGF